MICYNDNYIVKKNERILKMSKDKKQVEEITSMDEDFARWYTDIVKKAELIEYTSIKGCCVFRPYSYAIWENIQHALDSEFKRLGHENVYLPMFIPESLLEKEKDHVEGFAPRLRGSHTEETKSFPSGCVFARQVKPFSVSIIKT